MDESQDGIKITGRNINNLIYADDITQMSSAFENEVELKSFLMKMKEENEKVVLKLNIRKTKIMASHRFTANREKVEAVTDFIFLGSKITVKGDCSHEKKRCLRLGRKAMTNLDNILKSKDITLLTKVHIV